MESQLKPVLLNLLAAFVGAIGQYLYKVGAKKISSESYINWEIVIGAILFCAVMVLFIWAYKIGGNISVTYPVYSLTFLFGMGLGIVVDKELWNVTQFIGAGMIIAGIFVVVQFAPK